MSLKLKLLAVLICALTSLMPVASLMPVVEASPDWVTETSTDITVENDYYKLIFDTNSLNGHGRIRYFYIKPQDTVNIIPDNIWKMFAGHEILTANGTTQTDPRDWNLANVENVTTTVEYLSESLAIIKTDKWWKTYVQGYYQTRIISYWAFFKDKPYYLEAHRRIYKEDFSYIWNHEVCYFFNDTWVSTYKTLDENGTILTDQNPNEYIQIWEASRLGKYPWSWYHNSAYDLGIGFILLSANPTTTHLWPYYKSAGNYIEMQIESNIEAVKAGQTEYITVLTYITNDYTDVDSLATALVSSKETTETFLKTVQLNENKPSVNTRAHISTPNRVKYQPATNYLAIQWMYAESYGSFSYVKYQNSSGTYDLWSWSALTWEDYSWNGSYATVTFQIDFESKIRLRWKIELWNNSDAVRQTVNFTLLRDANVSAFYIQYRYSTGQARQRLNASVIKFYDYDPAYYENSWVEEVGIAFQNISGSVANEEVSLYANYYALNQTEALVSAGTSYVMVMKEQFYYRLKSEGLGAFDASDMLDFGESENSRFNILRWNKFPLHSNRDFAIKHYGLNYFVEAGSYENNELIFVTIGEDGETQNIELYVGNIGKPERILINNIESTSWTYYSSIQVLTIPVTYSSAQEVKVIWATVATGLYNLQVYVQKDGLPLANVNVTVGGNTARTNLFGEVTFQLPYGQYEVSATYGGKTKTVVVWLNQDKGVGILFDSKPPSGGWADLLLLPMFVIIVTLFILPKMFRKGRR